MRKWYPPKNKIEKKNETQSPTNQILKDEIKKTKKKNNTSPP